MSETIMELGESTLKVKPTVLRDGDLRDRLYAAFADFWPDILKYGKNTDRVFPMVQLELIP